jgi:hypothetical protein
MSLVETQWKTYFQLYLSGFRVCDSRFLPPQVSDDVLGNYLFPEILDSQAPSSIGTRKLLYRGHIEQF